MAILISRENGSITGATTLSATSIEENGWS